MKKWNDHLAELSLREKQTVFLGAIALVLLLFYLLIWNPLNNANSALREKIESDQKLLSWMQNADKRLQNLQQQLHPTARSKSVLSLMQSEINKTSFVTNMTALRQTTADSVQLNLQNVPFDNFIQWMTTLWQQDGIQISQLTALPGTEPGLVTIEVIVKG